MNKDSKVEQLKGASNYLASDPDNLVSGTPVRIISSDELFKSETEIGIVHQGAMYRLRVTRGGKLILNK